MSFKLKKKASAANCGVDEDTFLNSFEAVPKIQVYSPKDVDQHMSQINDCLADTNNDWEKRVDSVSVNKNTLGGKDKIALKEINFFK